MPELATKDIMQLATGTGFPRVSVYLPMEPAGRETRKNHIYVKNAAKDARALLLARSVSEREADDIVSPLLEMAEDNDRMQHQMSGLAIFLSAEDWQEIHIPIPFEPRTEVGDRYIVRPLVEPLTTNIEYAVLTLSEGGVAFYVADTFHLEPIDVPDLPEDLCTVLRFDDFEKSLQPHHTETGGTRYGIHGHGAGKDEQEVFLKRFVDAVAPVVDGLLAGRDLPLVLVGVEHVIGRMTAALKYPHVLPERLVKDPHSLSADELLREGRRLVAHQVGRNTEAVLERARSAGLVEDSHAVVEAAVEGRVAVLVADTDGQVRGRYDPQQGVHVERDPDVAEGADDLVDLAMVRTLQSGGEVLVLPDRPRPLAAVFRG